MNIKTILIALLTATTLYSCDNAREGETKPTLLSNLVKITDNEDKGVKDVLANYGGYCEYSIGTSASTEEGTIKYFELKLSKSETIESFENIMHYPASNIAYLFYRNLGEEQTNYQEIRSIIETTKGKSTSFSFSTTDLELVNNNISIMDEIVDLLKKKEFEQLSSMMVENKYYVFDKTELVQNLSKLQPQFGEVKGWLPFGFQIAKTDDGKTLLHISSIINREIKDHEFHINIEVTENAPKLLALDFKF